MCYNEGGAFRKNARADAQINGLLPAQQTAKGGFCMERRDKINYYLDIAEAVCARSTCLRRKFGANALFKGMNLMEGATTLERNQQIGGHKA